MTNKFSEVITDLKPMGRHSQGTSKFSPPSTDLVGTQIKMARNRISQDAIDQY